MQVFDLSVTKPSDFVQFGLACLDRMADLGDDCAKDPRENMRVMVCWFQINLSKHKQISAINGSNILQYV